MPEACATEETLLKTLKDLAKGHLVIVSGAGVSLASGIATFRGDDKNAVWKNDITTMGTFGFFLEDPVESWRRYESRFASLEGKEPNPAHFALVDLEQWQIKRGGRFTLVTQNIDGLHDKAGSQQLVNVHGNAQYVRCPTEGCKNGAPHGKVSRADIALDAFRKNPSQNTLPRCSICRAFYRQHVLWFDEMYQSHQDYGFNAVQEAACEMSAIVFVGTSFAVGVTEMLLQAAEQKQIPTFSVDPSERAAPRPFVQVIRQKSEAFLPRLVNALKSNQGF